MSSEELTPQEQLNQLFSAIYMLLPRDFFCFDVFTIEQWISNGILGILNLYLFKYL